MSQKKSFDQPTLLLVEHGATEFTAEGDKDRVHGTKYDLPLTREGHNQAKGAAEKLEDYDIGSLKTSPMMRSKETAKYISETTGQPAEEDEGLRPLDAGYLSGMTHDVAKRRVMYYVQHPDKQIPGGQTYGDWWDTASDRMAKRLKEVERNPEQGHVDVLHSSEIASMPKIIQGEGPGIWTGKIPGPGEISAVKKQGGRWRFINDWKGES